MAMKTSRKAPIPRVADLCAALEEIAPIAQAQSWDNVGLIVGDRTARGELINQLLSASGDARKTAHDALAQVYGRQHGYDPEADLTVRRAAARHWQLEVGR